MKTKFMILAGIALFVAITSCTKDDGFAYSCDKEVDRWVKKNLDEIQGMTTVEFLEFSDVAVQKGVYAAFSVEQKQNVWFNKIENLLQFDWTEKERAHIESLLNVINNRDFFGVKDDVVKEQFDLASYKWIEYAKEELGWSDRVIYAVSFTPNEVYKKDNLLQVSIEIPKKQSLVKRQIECNCDSRAIYDYCTENLKRCSYLFDNCTTNNTFCGFAWGGDCDGMCW